MIDTKQLQYAFLNETINWFFTHKRGIGDHPDNCLYSNGCAIGRHLEKKLAIELDKYNSIVDDYVFGQLPDTMQILGKGFLHTMQDFHDTSKYWVITDSGNTLNECGLERAKRIRKKIKNDLFDNLG